MTDRSASNDKPVLAMPHTAERAADFFSPDDMARIESVCRVRLLGSAEEDEILDKLHDVRFISGGWGMVKLTERVLEAAPGLEAVFYAAGSVKGFVTDASWERGIVITSGMWANAVAVAEATVAMITLANKNWFWCQDTIRRLGRDGWRAEDEPPFPGNYDATVGLIGFGAIGRKVAERLQLMDLSVLVYDPYVDEDTIGRVGAAKVELDELARASDVVSLHAPNIPETRHMIDADFLAGMRDHATFINTARGALVDEDALVAELESGRLFAMLDVTLPEPPEAGHPFYRLPNCWLTPHRAGVASREIRRMGRHAVDELLRYCRGDELQYQVHQRMLATMA